MALVRTGVSTGKFAGLPPTPATRSGTRFRKIIHQSTALSDRLHPIVATLLAEWRISGRPWDDAYATLKELLNLAKAARSASAAGEVRRIFRSLPNEDPYREAQVECLNVLAGLTASAEDEATFEALIDDPYFCAVCYKGLYTRASGRAATSLPVLLKCYQDRPHVALRVLKRLFERHLKPQEREATIADMRAVLQSDPELLRQFNDLVELLAAPESKAAESGEHRFVRGAPPRDAAAITVTNSA